MGFRRLFQRSMEHAKRDRRAVNTPVQGAGSDLGVLGLINMDMLLERAATMRSTQFGFVHDSLLFSVYPHELFDVCVLAQKGMVDMINRQVDWLKVPLKIDFEIGPSWGDLVEMEVVLNQRQVRFVNAVPKYHDMISDIFLRWDIPPVCMEHEEVQELEDGSEIFQTMSSVATREAQKVTLINSTWQFPTLKEVREAA